MIFPMFRGGLLPETPLMPMIYAPTDPRVPCPWIPFDANYPWPAAIPCA